MSSRPYVDIARQYAVDVLHDAIPACLWVKLACKRFLADLVDEGAWWRFDEGKAERVCRFIEKLPHVKGEWAAKRELIVLQPWQIFILVNVFGFLDRETGFRRFHQAMIVVPRKAGKSLMSAGVGLYCLVADGEHGAEVYCGASTERQAWEVFRPARLMAQKTPNLCKRFGLEVGAKSLSTPRDGSYFHPLVGKPGDGSNPHLAILDERHEHDDNTLMDAMRTGMGARSQPLLWTITTAGFNVASPCYDDVLTGRKVLDNRLQSDRRFYIEYTIDEDDDWATIDAARKANPNFGVSVKEAFIDAELKDAINITSKQAAYRTKYLCVWSQAKSAFHNLHKWNANRRDVDLAAYKGRSCIIGCDLAAKQDIASLVLLFKNEDGSLAVFSRDYLPSDAVEAPGRAHYVAWAADGKVRVSDGNMNDFDQIEADIDQMVADFDVTSIVIDARLASMIEQHMMAKGYPVESFVPSALNYTEPMRWIDGMINNGRLYHNSGPGDPLTWMMGNVVSKTNARDMEFPDKEDRDSKIDAAVALYMAASAHLAGDQTITTSLFLS